MAHSLHQILQIAQSGMLARFLELDVVSHNLANIYTPGYKASRANFQELLTNAHKGGVMLRSTTADATQGSIQISDNPLDIAIQGDGFFAVHLPDGRIGYTRAGRFTLDENQRIITENGFALDWQGDIPPTAEAIQVKPDGAVQVLVGGTWTPAGNIQLVRFPNPSGLLEYGQNIRLESEISGPAQRGTPGQNGYGALIGGAIEASNTDFAREMIRMIALQRGFEISLRSFQQTDRMLSLAIRMRGG